MPKHKRLFLVLAFTLLLIGIVLAVGAASALPMSLDDTPGPLPNDCQGVTEEGEPPPVCCAFGYVYYDGVPVNSAQVTIQGPSGSLSTTTSTGPSSTYAYYRVNLNASPLNVTPGDTITVTATYSDSTASTVYQVVTSGQQVDVVIPMAGGSQPPIGTINYIHPNPATQGTDTVAFAGSGVDGDEDGASIAAWKWASNLDGVLSTQEDFLLAASSLSVGTHTISFQVRDNEWAWSGAVTRTLEVEAEGSHYYVDDDGSNETGDGSHAYPWKTISYALTQVSGPNATIHVAAGTYDTVMDGIWHEVFPLRLKDGVSLVGAGAAVTIIDAKQTGTVIEATNISNQTRVEGFTIRNGKRSGGSSSLDGGGFTLSGSSPVIANNVIEGGTSYYGGAGIAMQYSSPVIENNVFRNNRNSSYGGVIDISSSSSPVIRNNQFLGNSGGMTNYSGGAIYIDATTTSNPVIVNNIIANTTGHGISSLYSGSRPIIANNTIVGSSHSGVYLDSNGTGTIFNNIIAHSGRYGIEEVNWSSYTNSDPSAVHYNLFYSNTRGHYLDEGESVYKSVHIMDSLIPECRNNREGDPTFANSTADDYHLQAGSLAINAGNNSAPQLPPTDFEGDPRIIYAVVDAGADEFSQVVDPTPTPWPTPIPTPTPAGPDYYVDDDGSNETCAGTPSCPWKTISYALSQVPGPNATIHVATGTYDTVMDGVWYEVFPLRLKDGVSLVGAGAGVTIIDAKQTGTVIKAIAISSQTRIEGFTIRKGKSASGSSSLDGGGFVLSSSSPITIANNIIEEGLSYYGGAGLVMEYSSPVIENNVFRNNRNSSYGGVIDISSSSNPVIRNNRFLGNAGGMTSYRGGAIYIDATTTSSPVIVNNIIANTTGHGISSDDSGSRPIITNNTIVGSTYSGIYLESGGKGSIFNNIIAYSGKYGIEEDDSASDPSTVQHNLFYSNTRGHYLDEGTTTYDSVLLMDAYIPECDNNREGDPRFANRTEDDYHLQVGSPPTAINTGTNSAPQLPPTDFEGDPRIINGIVDIGADEFAGPTITSLSPDSATAGGPGFTLTVNGTHFVSGSSVVRWNGSDHPTTYVSGTQLTAEITAADIATAGTASVTVFNPDPGGGTSNAKTFTINSPNVKTLILTNRAKIESLYGTSAASQLMNKLAQLATHSSVQGLVVQVENDAAVAAAYSQWDANNTTPRANAVTDAIKNLLNSLLATYPDVEYIVLVGDDRVIPYRRVPDKVPQYQWREHSYSCVSRDSTIGVALGDDMTLTDDFYADRVPTVPDNPGWDGHDLYIPDYALGRLIETPSEIIAVIDTFLAGSDVAVGTAIVTGYDFVKDGAQAMCNELTDDSLTTDCTLIGEHWGRDDFIPKVLNIRHEAISINGHAKHYCFGAPTVVGCAIPSSDFAGAGADLARVIFYSVGCHAGLNVPPGNPCQSLDLAQAIAQNSANYVANTGYGWGDLYSVGLSEKLMLEFTEQLLGGQSTTLGEALVKAKHDYYATEHGFDYYDEKIMIEAWLLGLPMYRYTTPGAAASTQFADVVEDAHRTTLANGLSKNSVTYQFPTFTSETTDDCVYYSLDGVVESANGQPIQPKYTTSVDFPGTTAHGLVFTGGLYNDIASFDPCIEQALTLTIASPILGEQPFTAPNWHPATFFKLNSLETLSGMTANLVAVLGQFNPNTGVERLYDETSFDIYYHTSSDDWATPTITSVSSAANGNATDITVGCTDTSGIYKVVIAHTADDGRWRSTDLAWDTGLGVWKGSIPITTSIEYLVQAVDNAGNVASNDNNGAYHCALFGDFNGDVDVDVADIMGVANHWRCKCGGACYNQRYDMDGDCDIDIVDIMKVVANWGATCW